jgi:hypothetical protein
MECLTKFDRKYYRFTNGKIEKGMHNNEGSLASMKQASEQAKKQKRK